MVFSKVVGNEDGVKKHREILVPFSGTLVNDVKNEDIQLNVFNIEKNI